MRVTYQPGGRIHSLRGGIVDRVQSGEVAIAHGQRGHRGETHRRRGGVVDGVIDAKEEEYLVLNHRAADVEAKIVEVLRRFERNAVKAKRRGIQRGVE